MKILVLDTNILLLRLRMLEKWNTIKEQFNFDNPSVNIVISSVVVGELLSIS